VRLLVLGGTKFLGRAIVEEALARGHEVTIFHRGQTGRGLFGDRVRELLGDRDGGLAPLEGGRWDAVVDTSGYFPRLVRASAELLADRADHYTFISSISVYDDFSTGPDEGSAVATLENETIEEFGDEYQYYGGLKALCEQAVERELPGRTLVLRPGLIVGPHDPTDRFTYWAERLARSGEILAPGPPERVVQFVDVRDLAAWIVRLGEARRTGVFNATNEGVSMGELLAGAEVTWVSDEFLVEQGVGEWIELPLWIADPEWAGHHHADVSRAVAAGLRFRPVAETVRDTAEWAATRGEHEPEAGLAPERERELLEAWRARAATR
jgi:2'-hydroxyisoflavone reductase